MNNTKKKIRLLTLPADKDQTEVLERMATEAVRRNPGAKRVSIRTQRDGTHELVVFRGAEITDADLVAIHSEGARAGPAQEQQPKVRAAVIASQSLALKRSKG